MPTPSDTLEKASQGKLTRPGRLRGAWLALWGAPVVPDQIRAEWAAWAWELEGLCDKISSAAARLATRDQRALAKAEARIAELEDDCGCHDDPAAQPAATSGHGWDPRKRALSRRILSQRGLNLDGVLAAKRNGDEDVAPD